MSPRHAARAAATETARIRDNPLASLQNRIDRIRQAKWLITDKIKNGEYWLLPLLKRFNAELASVEETQDLLLQAIEMSSHAAPHRAA